MKSIKEKAKEYGLFNPDIHYDEDGNTYDNMDKPSMDFEAGANYVFDEIGSLLEAANKCKSHSIPTWRLRYIIKQLKK